MKMTVYLTKMMMKKVNHLVKKKKFKRKGLMLVSKTKLILMETKSKERRKGS
jgi:hypothetical protein